MSKSPINKEKNKINNLSSTMIEVHFLLPKSFIHVITGSVRNKVKLINFFLSDKKIGNHRRYQNGQCSGKSVGIFTGCRIQNYTPAFAKAGVSLAPPTPNPCF